MHLKKSLPTVGVRAVATEYWRLSRKYPTWIFWLAVGIVGIQAAQVVRPILLRDFLNVLAGQPSSALVQSPIVLLVLIGLSQVIGSAFHRLEMWTNIELQVRVMADLARTSFAYLVDHSHHFFISNFAGTLTRRVTRYTREYETIVDSLVAEIVPTILYIAGITAVLWTRSRILALVLFSWALAFILLQYIVVRLQENARREKTEADSTLTGALSDVISNHATVMLFSGGTYERSRLDQVLAYLRRKTYSLWMAEWQSFAWQSLLAIAINIGILYGALVLWQKGSLQVGDFVLIQLYLLGLFDRVWGLGRQFRKLLTSFSEAAEMVDILHTPHGIADRPHTRELSVSSAGITFTHVRFGFHAERPVLSDFSLTIAPGEKIALVGPSGAGKTTVTKLLLRLYDRESGSIEIDGQDVAAVSQESLRRAIAFVPQEPILFHRSLMENIRYGRRDASDIEVIEAARKAHCNEFIERLPHGYETMVGERGVKLSGGERQRIAIARAILKDAPILVLDEATSSLDSESEHLIQDALSALMRKKTVIVIAHRLSTIMQMDRILVIEHGAIAAQGSHEELLKKGGRYRSLWEIQAGGFVQAPRAKRAARKRSIAA